MKAAYNTSSSYEQDYQFSDDDEEDLSFGSHDQTVKRRNTSALREDTGTPTPPPNTIWATGERSAAEEAPHVPPPPAAQDQESSQLEGLAVIDYLNKKGMGSAALELSQILKQAAATEPEASAASTYAEATGYAIPKTQSVPSMPQLYNPHAAGPTTSSAVEAMSPQPKRSLTNLGEATDFFAACIINTNTTQTQTPSQNYKSHVDITAVSNASGNMVNSTSAPSMSQIYSLHAKPPAAAEETSSRSSHHQRTLDVIQEEPPSPPTKVKRTPSATQLMRRIASTGSGKSWRRTDHNKAPSLTDFFPASDFDNNDLSSSDNNDDLSSSERGRKKKLLQSKWSKLTSNTSTLLRAGISEQPAAPPSPAAMPDWSTPGGASSEDKSESAQHRPLVGGGAAAAAQEEEKRRQLPSADNVGVKLEHSPISNNRNSILPPVDSSNSFPSDPISSSSSIIGNGTPSNKEFSLRSTNESILDGKWAAALERGGMASVPSTKKELNFWSKKGLTFEWKQSQQKEASLSDEKQEKLKSDEQQDTLKIMFPSKSKNNGTDNKMDLDESILDSKWRDNLNGMSSVPQTEKELKNRRKRSFFQWKWMKSSSKTLGEEQQGSSRRTEGEDAVKEKSTTQEKASAFFDLRSVDFGLLDLDEELFQKDQCSSDKEGPETLNTSKSMGGEMKKKSLLNFKWRKSSKRAPIEEQPQGSRGKEEGELKSNDMCLDNKWRNLSSNGMSSVPHTRGEIEKRKRVLNFRWRKSSSKHAF